MNYFPGISLQIFKSLKKPQNTDGSESIALPSSNTNSQLPSQTDEINAENQLSVSRSEGNLFDPAEQISLSDVPSDQRQKNSFYRWFKRKLWCIKRSKSADSLRVKTGGTLRNVKMEAKKTTPEFEPQAAEKSKVDTEPQSSQHPVSHQNRAVQTPNVNSETPSTPQISSAPIKDRQVTFSDTVKTHIKTKYVTAEELQQIRSMNMNNRRILYQYPQNAECKGGIAVVAKARICRTKRSCINRMRVDFV